MGLIVTPALVVRRADYSDYDRMVTLFSPDIGRIDAIARGCRRPKSPLVNAVEPFTSGEFQLYERRERYTLEQCQILPRGLLVKAPGRGHTARHPGPGAVHHHAAGAGAPQLGRAAAGAGHHGL